MITSIISVVCLYFLYKLFFNFNKKEKPPSNKPFPLHRQVWKKELVYLVQFPVAPQIRSISPYCIKLETWLRMTGIPFESVYSAIPGIKRQIPYIEFNGQHIPDSNLIIDYLKNYYRETIPKVLEVDCELTPEQNAVAHLTKRMLENHTAVGGFYWRYVRNMEEFYRKLMAPAGSAYSAKGMFLFRKIMPPIIGLKCYLHGISRHSEEGIAEMTFRDLDAISQTLGDNKFYFGDHPTSIDCTIFGHLVQFLYMPLAFPQKEYMKKNCQNIVDYMERIKGTFWPDWDDQCKNSCMEGKMGRRFKKEEKP